MYKAISSLRILFVFFLLLPMLGQAQKSSAEIYAQIKKLQVVGSVLYFAAHPDDENNAFLPYLTKERNYRTAYLSLTRGDGGQNLIGKEQGVELGMIRTQELLAARKIDGAEQYFSTAYEFGFSKSSEEALRIWDHEKVLSDAVWVIRKFQPDIIITRFPTDARAGHGHHSASAIIANEAYIAAADPARFPEQLKLGVSPWKAKRILWNTFNFGTVNTTNEQQIKMEVGGYNPVLGKSYGEVGADARTMHKSQGEGRPGRRGSSYEYFETTGGDKPTTDIMDGVNTSWTRLGANNIQQQIDVILQHFQIMDPAASIPALVALYQNMQVLPSSLWKAYKMEELQSIIQACAGLFMEATTQQAQVVPGANLQVQFWLNCRNNCNAVIQKISFPLKDSVLQSKLTNNQNIQFNYAFNVPSNTHISQPYWLVQPKTEGMFVVNDQQLIGKAQNDPVFSVGVQMLIEGQVFNYSLPVQYKYLDPTKGDQYQPLVVVPEQEVKFEQDVYLIKKEGPFKVAYQSIHHQGKTERVVAQMSSSKDDLPNTNGTVYTKTIQYDHIPTLTYFPTATTKIVVADVKIKGNKVGYIDGAGDKLPEALIALGYELVPLKESDLVIDKIKSLDAIVIGVRAYNMFAYLTDKNDVMNQYIEQGGNLIVQYLKSNQVGIRPVKVGPYAFTVNAGKRVTQEEAPVTFNFPDHPVLNHPNKITSNDFNDWVQERSTYQADSFDSHFAAPFTMNDKGEAPSNGSLLVAPYGKGNMVYLSLVLFRQLPAGNAGAYKLLANLVSLPKH